MTRRATPEITAEHLHDRIAVAHDRLASLVTALAADPVTAGAGPWSLTEVVAHLVNVTNRYNDFDPARLAADPRGVDAVNARELETLAGRALPELLTDLADELARFHASWGPARGLPLATPIPFHGGATIDLECGLANLLAELLVHGRDLAVTAGRPWTLDDGDALAIWRLATVVLPFYARRSSEPPLLVRFDLDGATPWTFVIDARQVDSRPTEPGDDADVVLRGPAEPVALLFYGRIPAEQLAACGVTVGGRHPELVATVTGRFEEP